jgi:phosphatidate cytidylyltransferase
MLRQRLIVGSILVPLVVGVIILGGPVYLLAALLTAGLATWEYTRLFSAGGLRPARPLVIGGNLLLVASAWYPWLNPRGILFAFFVIVALAWHLIDFERGAPASGTDFCVTLAGFFYLGWLSSYLVSVRLLPQGLVWTLAAATAASLADSFAYIFGHLWGKHKLAPYLSPNKTWEGYWGGVLTAALGTSLLAGLFQFWGEGATISLTWQSGALLGVLIGLLSPIGDLGVSMLKRQVGVKDTGRLLPGHGGIFDRIDSWLVAVPLAYYLALLLQK